MTKVREILRPRSMGLSQRDIASSCQCARNTVADVLHRAQSVGIAWPIQEDVDDKKLAELLLSGQTKGINPRRTKLRVYSQRAG